MSWVKVPGSGQPPKPVAKEWAGLIGEYGWDHDILYIFEKDGQLWCNIEWFFIYPLKQETQDIYSFPDWGLYQGEKMIFTRNSAGKATEVVAASVRFMRRSLNPDRVSPKATTESDWDDHQTFHIIPIAPIATLKEKAITAKPPQEKGKFLSSELVELAKLDSTIHFDLRYATDNNFLQTPLYPKLARAYMQKPAALALARVQESLKKQGLGLLIHDAYRPWSVTKLFWDATPEKYHHFVADPKQGSRHNRGCAVDLTLYDLKTGKPIQMVGGYDEFSDRSYAFYLGGTSRQRYYRNLLRQEMEKEDFRVYEAEWWHFDYKNWKNYPILNQSFEELADKK